MPAPDTGAVLIVMGVLLVFTPAITAPRGGLDDYIRWMAKQPLRRILAFRYAVLSGMLIVAMGVALNAAR